MLRPRPLGVYLERIGDDIPGQRAELAEEVEAMRNSIAKDHDGLAPCRPQRRSPEPVEAGARLDRIAGDARRLPAEHLSSPRATRAVHFLLAVTEEHDEASPRPLLDGGE